MRDVALLDLNPAAKAQQSVGWVIHAMFPNRFGQRDEQLICRLAQATNYFERLARTLVKVPQSAGPTCRIKFQDRAFRLCDKTAASDVGAGFAVSSGRLQIYGATSSWETGAMRPTAGLAHGRMIPIVVVSLRGSWTPPALLS
jgi:hypothetical protein